MFNAAGTGTDSFTWPAAVASTGIYKVYARWVGTVSLIVPDARYTVHHAGGTTTLVMNQKQNQAHWNLLGTFTLDPAAGHKVVLSDQATAGLNVVADAIRFVRLGEARAVQADAVKFTPNTAEPLLHVRADHLGTPQKVTDPSGAVVWNATYLPYGTAHSITGSVTYNQRFPGQYFDAETGLHYNYRRDYDPAIGRYIQADPIGLEGGINRYGYADGNPITLTDPTGEFVPQLVGFGIGAGLEYFTNPCATFGDLLLAGAIGSLGGGLSKAALLGHGARSLTRETGKEWSHSISRKVVDRFTSGNLNRALNQRGGLNGSWTTPSRHYRHDAERWPTGWQDFGRRLPEPFRSLDRIPDWLKGTAAAGAVGAAVAGSKCGCQASK